MARPNFMEKTFAVGSITTKLVNVFSLESFPLYGNTKLNVALGAAPKWPS